VREWSGLEGLLSEEWNGEKEKRDELTHGGNSTKEL
jgi:hypothetical protein